MIAIICDICAQEVEIISFGTGYVGVSCNKVFYNDEYRPLFDTEHDEKKDIYMVSKTVDSYQAKHA